MAHQMDKEYLRLMAEQVKAKLPDNHGFLLLTAPFGDLPAGAPENRTTYCSNMKREDAIKLLKEFLFRIGEAEDWMKHIK
jgi:hypothetical protein